MNLLVTYDVATDTPEGRRRLRRVAQICENYGQRVQKSVFECSVSDVQLEQLRYRLLKYIDTREDSLRIYHLSERQMKGAENYGISRPLDFDEPMIV